MAWTPEQLQAINEEGKNIIVSAGAGSGKTAVLTERTIRKLKTGVHINELLVLTFTNAAAAEMKDRIRRAINKTPGLEEEANLIDGAYITTFDSFSLSVVKKYHTKLNVSNNIKITDDVIINIEKNKILDEIFEENYLSPKEKFTNLIKDFCLKDDKELKDYILNSYKKIELKYDRSEYLSTYLENYYSKENIQKLISEYIAVISSYQKDITNLITDLNSYFDGTYVTKVSDALEKFLSAKTYAELKNSLLDVKLPAVPRNSDEEGKNIKTTISSLISDVKDLLIYESEEEMQEEILSTKENASVIISILKELDKRIENYKRENEIYNFTDIAHLAIKAVKENPDIREELSASFNEILVDEYQDTSDTQELFISLISHNNVYMVGDIKQSIYRFRNANPYIFKDKYDTYRDTDKGIKIDLNKNFRSRKEVLSNINLLFDLFMDDEIGGAAYQESHRMVFGNNLYIEKGSTDQNYDLDVLTYELEKNSPITKDEHEIFIIGQDIKEKIASNYQIFDKDTSILRTINYSDIVILLDKSKNFDLYKKIFEYLHIPLSIEKDSSLRKDQDILVIKSLLKFLKCLKTSSFDQEFKYSFISLARSFLFNLPDDEIYHYYVTNTYKDSIIYQTCLELVKSIDTMSAAEYLDYILTELHYEEKLLTIGSILSYRTRLEYIYNLINDYSSSGNTIYDFIEYLDEIYTNDYDLKFKVNESSTNSCKIMTIHKSKGLEFPICYFAGFTSNFNISELKEKIIFDNKCGLVLPKVDEYYKETIIKTLLKRNTKKEEISERIRLLYVALTRAKEKMIIVIPTQEETKEVTSIVPVYERSKYNSFLSILKSIYSVLLPYVILKEPNCTKDYLKTTKSQAEKELILPQDNLKVDEISIETSKVEESHFSKETLHIFTKEENELLEFGTKVHELLETLDFTKPFSLESKHLEQKISAFINSSLIQENLNYPMYKEYEFIYEEDNTLAHGIIDLLIETPTRMLIIDYKLKNIDDSNYDKQLNGYRKAIKEKTKKEVSCYLYSILEERFREVEEK